MNSPKSFWRRLDAWTAPALGFCAAALLMALMVVTCLDVAARYAFNRPLAGAFELTEVMLAALIFAGLPLVSLRGEHVSVDLLDSVTPDWLFRLQHALACAVCLVCTAYLAGRLWIRADTLASAGETTAQLKIPLAWLAYGMSVLMGFTAAAFALRAFRLPPRKGGTEPATL